MSIMDSQLLFNEGQSIAGNSGTSTTSTNAVYIPKPVDHKGTALTDRPNVSQRLCWNCVVEDEDLAAAADSCALTIALYHHTAADAVASGAVLDTIDISVDQASNYPDGTKVFSRPLPNGQFNPYLECKFTKATQNLSTGKVTTWIGPPIQEG